VSNDYGPILDRNDMVEQEKCTDRRSRGLSAREADIVVLSIVTSRVYDAVVIPAIRVLGPSMDGSSAPRGRPAFRRATACWASNACGQIFTNRPRGRPISAPCPAWSVFPRAIRTRSPPATIATSATQRDTSSELRERRRCDGRPIPTRSAEPERRRVEPAASTRQRRSFRS
jgi:hypothetical protein